MNERVTIDFPFFDAVLAFFVGVWNLITDVFEFFAVDLIGFMISSVADWVVDLLENVVVYLWHVLDSVWVWLWWLIYGFVDDIWEWLWPILASVLGDMLLWLDGFLPASWSINTSWVANILIFVKTMGFFLDLAYIVTMVGATFALVVSINAVKFLWRCIPGVG